jgi:redox-sensitive bicupin YhaK (pirin superfamily)
MSIEFSPVVAAVARGSDRFSVKSIDLEALGHRASPLQVLDDFRVRGQPFGPHPHAGFAAVTYVFEDSAGSLRSRDSLGHDLVVGPGGMVWSHAGSGMLHEELPADLRQELHGLQFFVNLSSKNKLSEPCVMQLLADDVPEWRSDSGDRVRVVVGNYADRWSPLVPVEPFNMLDVELRNELEFDIRVGHHTVIYALNGSVTVRLGSRSQTVTGNHALGIRCNADVRLTVSAREPSRFLVLAGADIREPVVSEGPFIMNDYEQIEAAVSRYESGAMGRLAPAPRNPG